MDIREFTGLNREFGFADLGAWQGRSRGDKNLRKIRGLLNRGIRVDGLCLLEEPQPFTLFGPTQGKVLTQFVKVQVARLATRKDGFDNVRRQEDTAENLAA